MVMYMYKKQKIMFIGLEIICFIFVIVGIGIYNKSWFLFPDIQQEDVLSVEVTFGAYPNYPLTKRDQIKLVDYMRQIEVSRTKEDYREYTGLISKMFVLHMNEDSDITISASPPFFILDEKGYMCSCDALFAICGIYDNYPRIMRAVSRPIPKNNNNIFHTRLYIKT